MARVLVVEDEDVSRLLVESRLRAAGHRVRAAASVAEARTVLERAGVPEVLVTDMFMPGGSGLALVSSLREDSACADLPVIILSGRALPADVEAGQALGATHLTKPFSPAALLGAVDAALAAGANALEHAVRARLAELGDVEDEEERALFARLLTSFVEQAPVAVADVERALSAGDAAALQAGAHRLAGLAANLGAQPLARLCADLDVRAQAGEVPLPTPTGPALRRALTSTCLLFTALVHELSEVGADGGAYA